MKRADDAKKVENNHHLCTPLQFYHIWSDWKEKKTFFFTPCIIKVDKTISLQSLLLEWMNQMHGISPTWDLQGDPNQNLKFLLTITLKIMYFWPHVNKAKVGFRGVHLFSFFSCMFSIFKINVHLSNAFWLYQHEVRNA